MSLLLHKPPSPSLAPFVERLWYSDDRERDTSGRATRERALPTGCADLVVRLAGDPIRVYRGIDDPRGEAYGFASISGTRSSYHVRDTSRPSCSVGVHFRPGGAAAWLGVPAHELAERHTALADLWGTDAELLRERLLSAVTPEERLAVLETELLAHRSERSATHPAVLHALARFGKTGVASVAATTRETGLSPRRMIELFRRSVGLTPKVFCRILRFQRAVARAARGRGELWTDLAQACGFHDQSHLTREFRAFAGIAPGDYVPLSRERPNHVPVPACPAR